MTIGEDVSGKILIVDDQAYNRELLSFILQDNGYECVTAVNGMDAVSIMEVDNSIDLVLMDVNMPVMDGFEATRQIKAEHPERYIPIVFVTALDDDETLAKCLAVGGDDFIPKPVNDIVLLAKVAANTRTANLYQQLQTTNDRLVYHQKVMDREHAIVEHVFRNGMRRVDMDCHNIRYSITPLSMFNGDLLLSAPNPSGGVYVLLGDFTGHGLSAAIGCLPVSDIFYAMTRKHADVGEIAYEMNIRLQSLLPSYMFFCAAIFELSVNGDRLSYWIGGMNDVLLVRKEGGISERLSAQHMPLGVLESHEFDSSVSSISVATGTKAFIYTDGVIEGQNSAGEMFGEERLEALFQEPRESYVDVVGHSVNEFQQAQRDDISFVELLCAPVTHGNPDALEAFLESPKADVRLPWCMSATLEVEDIKRGDVIGQVIRLITNETSLSPFKDSLFTVLSELFNNALDHGLLGLDSSLKDTQEGFWEYYQLRAERLVALDSGSIDVELRLIGKGCSELKLTISHSGQGLCYVDKPVDVSADQSYGRGMLLVESLCQSIEYSDDGRTAVAVFALRAH